MTQRYQATPNNFSVTDADSGSSPVTKTGSPSHQDTTSTRVVDGGKIAMRKSYESVRHEEYMRQLASQEPSRMMQQKSRLSGTDPEELLMSQASEQSDMVNHPPHYNQHGVECIEAIQAMTDDGFEAYLQGNIMKYLWRYKYKNGLQDLKKAEWYLAKLIEVHDD